MQEIDVETMARKAYGEFRMHQLQPKQILAKEIPMSPGNLFGGGGIETFLALGTRVDTSLKIARPAIAFLRAAESETDDMCAFHDAVLALPDVYFEPRGIAGELWTRETAKEAGAEIVRDTIEGRWLIRHPVRGDRRVEEIVTSLLVIRHGQNQDRPDWCPGGSMLYPVYRAGSGPKTPVTIKCEYGKACLVEFRPLPESVTWHRSIYAVWHWALAQLVERPPALRVYELRGPRVSPAPWDESRTIHKAIA